jgi:hypothetical protein
LDTTADTIVGLLQVDWRIMLLVWVMYSSLDLVRRNINRAISDNMLDDLGVNTNDFNTGQTIYLVFFLAAELPGGLISKKVGPFRYTPAVIVLWGGISMAQAGMKSRWSFWLLRALLGLAQGGFIPEMVCCRISMVLLLTCRLDPLPVVLLQVQRTLNPHELVLYRDSFDASLGQSSGWRHPRDARHQELGWMAMAV